MTVILAGGRHEIAEIGLSLLVHLKEHARSDDLYAVYLYPSSQKGEEPGAEAKLVYRRERGPFEVRQILDPDPEQPHFWTWEDRQGRGSD